MKKTYLIVLFLLVLVFSIYYMLNYRNLTYSELEVAFANGQSINCYLADSYNKQRLGLSNFDSLDEDSGMLFVYDNSSVRSVWMKDMNFGIDVIWLDKDKYIVKIDRELLSESYPKQYSSQEKVKYFIEVNSGFVESNNIKLGQYVDF